MTRQDRTADTLRDPDSIESLRSAILTSDAIVIGAGSGLSTAAGFRYSGKFFKRYFGDFMRKYGIRDMYSGGFFPFPTREEFWAWWSRHIWLNRYAPLPGNLYSLLLSIVRDRDFFVLTTNVDHCFQRAGFDKKRLFYTQGDYGLFQSSRPHGASINKTYDNEGMVREMLLSQGFSIGADGELLLPEDGSPRMEIDSGLIPHCPDDGLEMAPNLRSDDTFVEDDGWHEAAGRYADFLAVHGIKATGFFTEDGISEQRMPGMPASASMTRTRLQRSGRDRSALTGTSGKPLRRWRGIESLRPSDGSAQNNPQDSARLQTPT